MRPDNFDVQKVVDYLQGTANTLDGALEELFPGMEFQDLTTEDHNVIDNQIFLCETCNWWCEVSERTENEDEEGNCRDCSPENDW